MNQLQQLRREHVAERREDAERERNRRQERLIDDAVDLRRVVGAGKARHQHPHAGVERTDEDDDHEEDLPADADRRVAGEADVVTDHHVIDDALEPADHVLQHGGPRQTPHRPRDRTFDDRTIERRGGRRRFRVNEIGGRRIRDDGSVRRWADSSAIERLYQAGWRRTDGGWRRSSVISSHPSIPSSILPERVAVLRIATVESALEPGDALFG